MYEIAEGTKYQATKGLDLADVAKLIRADIKAAVKAGELPADLKASVRISRYSGGQSLSIRFEAPSVNPISPQWAKLDENDRCYNRGRVARLTEEGARIAGVITAIQEAYNYDGSDRMTDYYNVRFYGSAEWDYDFLRACQVTAAAYVPTAEDLAREAAADLARIAAEEVETAAYLARRQVEIAEAQAVEAVRVAGVKAGEAIRDTALAAAILAPASGPATVYAVAITVLWSESGAAGLADGTCYITDWAGSAWSKVEAVLKAAAVDAPDTGAYDKTRLLIHWSDETTTDHRMDLQRRHADMVGPLADDMADMATPGMAHILSAELPAAVEALTFEAYKARVRAEVEAEIGNAPTLGTIIPFRPRQVAELTAVAGDLAPVIAGPAVRVVNEAGARFAFWLGIED